jgi:hypothetical protein
VVALQPDAGRPTIGLALSGGGAHGMSDGIGAVRRAERQTGQTVEWLGDD